MAAPAVDLRSVGADGDGVLPTGFVPASFAVEPDGSVVTEVGEATDYRIVLSGDEAADKIRLDAKAVDAAGAFSVVLEMVPSDVAAQVTKEIAIPTIGIGAGNQCDGQVLVWQDFSGLNRGRTARFVKKYADLRGELSRAAADYVREVKDGNFPAAEHSFES